MFLRISVNKRGKRVYKYAQIAERYREDGRQKTRILEYLGPIRDSSDIDRYKKALELAKEKSKIIGMGTDDFSIYPSMEFGIVYASFMILKDTGVLSAIKRNVKVYSDMILFMSISRLIEPASDLALIDMQDRIYYPWSGIEFNDDRIYRALDRLISVKGVLEEDIFKTLNPDTSVVHYDLTSTYFEGREDNDLVVFGYSRDKKRGKEQIVIGLVMAGGIPIHHEVWKGNTVDPKTLESTITTLKERFHIKNVIFIGDRAFGRSPSLKLLDRNRYITAAYRWDQPYRDIITNTLFSDRDREDDLFIREVSIDVEDLVSEDTTGEEKTLMGKRRHILVYNQEREALDLMDLDDKINTIKKKISEIDDTNDLRKSLGSLKSFVKIRDNTATMNEKHISVLRKLAGRFLVVTNTDLPESEVVSAYKDQWQIERSFRTIKSFIEIRPVYHRKPDRIRAHVFVCVLSLLISRLIEKRSEMTIAEASKRLSYLKATPVKLHSGTVMIGSESEIARNLLNKIGLPYPDKVLSGARKN